MTDTLFIRISKVGQKSEDCVPPFKVVSGKVKIVNFADADFLISEYDAAIVDRIDTGERLLFFPYYSFKPRFVS